ncbi:MAG: hypothetical protein ACTSVC_15860 [Promethearchaeota archaeon]
MAYALISDYFVELFGLKIRIIADIINVLSLNIMRFVLLRMPDYREFLWNKKVEFIIVFTEGGIPVYSKSFKEQSLKDDNITFLGGTLSVIQTFINNLTKGDFTKLIKFQDYYLMFYIEERSSLIGCLIVDEHSRTLELRLKKFMESFSDIFVPVEEYWRRSQDPKIFLPIETLSNEIFRININKR